MRVRWSRPAQEDLRAILDYLGAENPLAARRLVLRLDGILRRIAQFPESAPMVEQRPGVRRIPLVRYPYILYYKDVAGEAVILRIRHGAMEKPWEDLD
jgi:plasmid stabilization system protein ParE